MSKMINVTINGQQLTCQEGEFILNVARANDIFVPAICYQTKCSPTLACRLCLVEADGKQVYACNAKTKDGMVVNVDTPNIITERRAIMEVYDVNHPLQCGVCDQSGECELQNYSLYMEVDSQSYCVKDVNRPALHWGVMKYDPGLCIVCEKCVTVCKDMIGSNALGTVKRGGDDLDKNFKATMPKDAYAMWNKLNKSLIGFEEDKCIDCGECIAVCPVGALVSSDFQYKSNAWELTKVPAANPHSSDCTLMYYEVKHDSIANNINNRIYRVTNDAHYASLSGAARFAFDYRNNATKDEVSFQKAVDAVKNADTIVFNSFITNEEALMLQKIKEATNCKLVNDDAKRYQDFMKAYATVTGKSLYNGTLQDIHNSNFLISVGSYLKSDSPSTKYAFNNAITMNKGAGLYFHPMGDTHIEGFGKKGKNIETIQTIPGCEDAVLYFILEQFGKDLPSDIKQFLDTQKEIRTKTVVETIKEEVIEVTVDPETGEEKETKKQVPKKIKTEVEYTYSKLIDAMGANEDLLETLQGMLEKKDTFSLIIGQDCINHPNALNLARLCGVIETHTDFKVVVIPTQTNTLGVSLICNLDNEASGKTVGYNVNADFQLSALGDGDIDMPAFTQIEGTFTNIDKRVVPTNAALPYHGYELNDIANCVLGVSVENSIDYTSELFNKVAFDDLENYFANDWTEHRGYTLTPCEVSTQIPSVECEANGVKLGEGEYFIYNANPINQFNEFTALSNQLKDDIVALYISSSMKEKLEVEAGDHVLVETSQASITLQVRIDNTIVGDISYIPTFDKNIDTKSLFKTYRFNTAKLKRV
ncbi:MAG: NADH-quinone oxidoreductase subunit G [Campylobacterales bacterium]|nr:NADH-quinone oxidoreductase subunit G [Campylobacterales bacterium]